MQKATVRGMMIRGLLTVGVVVFSVTFGLVPAVAQQVQRKMLLTQDLAIPGYEMVLVAVEIPPEAERADIPILVQSRLMCRKAF